MAIVLAIGAAASFFFVGGPVSCLAAKIRPDSHTTAISHSLRDSGGRYTAAHSILTVGDGDFSFSASLASVRCVLFSAHGLAQGRTLRCL